VKAVVRLVAGVTAGGLLALFAFPFLVVAVVAGQVQQAAQVAAAWDIPPEVVPALAEAGQQAGVPWFLLAGVASVATDFARHAPDGLSRGDTPGTAIFPSVIPPITGGMFLADARPGTPVPADAEDVRTAAQWLAQRMAELAGGATAGAAPGVADLTQPAAARFWQAVVAAAPLRILAVSPSGADVTPVDPGANPIRQFGGAVMARINAPVTAANLDAFAAWAAGEGTCARYNPLATTQPEPGATPFNTFGGGLHVWNYPSFAVGVQATTTALTNGLYRPVIAAFVASAGVAAVAMAVEQSPWGTRAFGSTTYGGKACGGNAGPSEPPPTLPTITGVDAVPATIVARAARYQVIWSQMVAMAR
jgi:hypothetical protein